MTKSRSIRASHVTWDIAEARAKALGISVNSLISDLIWFAGLTGGDHPLTTQIRHLPEPKRQRILAEILKLAQANHSARPQSFKEEIRKAAGQIDQSAQAKVSASLISLLLQ